MNGLVINKQKEYPRKQSSAASEHSKYQELKWQQHRLTSFSLYAYISVNSLTLFITHTWKDICCWTFTFSNASLVLKDLHFIQYAYSGTSLFFLFYSSCISNCILTAMPPPAFKNFRFHSYLFLQRMCLHGCHSISKMTRTWQQLFSWSMSFLPVHALSIQRFGDFLFAAEIQQKTTVFILLNNEKLFVGQNTICEDVTLATGSLF